MLVKILTIVIPILISIDVYAVECGNVRIDQNRSPGVTVIENPCKDDDKVALGSRLTMSPSSRLWLKSSDELGSDVNYELICQNRSNSAITLEVTRLFEPWINTPALNCRDWTDNKLICDGAGGERDGFICAMASVKRLQVATAIERTTSVKMRGLDAEKEKEPLDKVSLEKQVIEALQSEAALCRSVYNPGYRVTAQWSINEHGKLLNSNIFAPKETPFNTCIEAAINHFNYPKFPETVWLKQDF